MKMFGNALKPLVQILATFLVVMIIPFFILTGVILTTYILFWTKYWLIAVLYLLWIWVIDKHTPETGGRRNEKVCNSRIFKYTKDYFPANLEVTKGLRLDAKRNYLFCVFPHGIIPIGSFLQIVTNAANFNEFFPYHKVNGIVLSRLFKFPIIRDIMMFLGGCSSSQESLDNLLGNEEGGRIAALAIGGVEEAYYAHPGNYHLVLKNRKGFVKAAIRNGSPLVPVFSFGEIELFDQISWPKGTPFRKFQGWCKRHSGIPSIICFGRFVLIPKRRPLNVVVGTPIEVSRNRNPTQEDIDALHSKFISELTKLFEKYKHKYIKDHKNVNLIIT